ncbi:MAG TPA: ABC transporter permease [Microthrixaceae bacterium]|nr:ABC transporter permease [Microthrixaceae bacterium]
MRALTAQLRTELTLSARQGEQLLVSIGIPLGVLVFFSQVDVLRTGDLSAIDFLAPAVLALAVMSSAMVSLGIGTGFERYYGVLKRLGATPLGRPRLVTAKMGSVLVTELAQFAVLITVAIALGWDPDSGWAPAALGALLGTAAFAGLGLLMAGTLPGPLNLAACNGLYLVLLVTGGMVVPFEDLPGPMRAVSELLPAAALSDVMIGSLTAGESAHAGSWIVLVAWAVVLPTLAASTFRWEP